MAFPNFSFYKQIPLITITIIITISIFSLSGYNPILFADEGITSFT